MRALLLAAGFGTRLRPLTDTVPKCLVPVKGRPLLEIWLERLSDAGIGPFLVNAHYLADRVESFVESSQYRDRVTVVKESTLKGTAGTLIYNLDFFQGEDALLIHADNYCLADFGAFMAAHRERPAHCLMTMMTFASSDPTSCGIVQLDGSGVVTSFHEKVADPPGRLANGAVYLLSRELLLLLGSELRHVTDFSTEVLQRLVGRIFTYQTHEVFLDIGTPQTLAAANES